MDINREKLVINKIDELIDNINSMKMIISNHEDEIKYLKNKIKILELPQC